MGMFKTSWSGKIFLNEIRTKKFNHVKLVIFMIRAGEVFGKCIYSTHKGCNA
jgi:hypothetical protein